MPRRGSFVPIAVVLVVGAAITEGLAACDDPAAVPAPTTDGGGDESVESKTSCPKAEPIDKSACNLPEGTTCDFGACGTNLFSCTLGLWTRAGNLPPSPPCPADPPAADASCPSCWPTDRSCVYPTICLEGDAGSPQNTAIASCVDEIWSLEFRPCIPKEAGADVQGDAGQDGD